SIMQQHSNTGGFSLKTFLADLVVRNLESVLAANTPEPVSEPVKPLAGMDIEGLILACDESVKSLAWKFARSSDGRVDVDDLYSIGMLEICECVAAGRLALAGHPVAYLVGVARLAMCEEWRRLYGRSIESLDAPLSDGSSTSLGDLLADPTPVAPA